MMRGVMIMSRRIAGAGGRMFAWFILAILCIYLYMSTIYGWSDRRCVEAIWFFRDVRYWADICVSLAWVATGAMFWRVLLVVIERLTRRGYVKRQEDCAGVNVDIEMNGRWCLTNLLYVGDWLGRGLFLLALVLILWRGDIISSASFLPVLIWWHGLFDPLGYFLLHGLSCPYLKDMPVWRIFCLPVGLAVIIPALYYCEKLLGIIGMIKQVVCKSWVATGLFVVIASCAMIIVSSFLSWFIDGFYRVPVTLYMATGKMTWPLFVLPGMFLVFASCVIYGLKVNKNTNKTKGKNL